MGKEDKSIRQVSMVLRSGDVSVRTVPSPSVPDAGVLVRVARSVISKGTEQTLIETGSESLLTKARRRPDAVAKVLQAVRRDGIKATVDLVRDRLGSWDPVGYACAGVIEEVGRYGGPFRVGDRVACAGGGHASHAEVVAVPRNLVASIPPGVSFEAAAYASLGSIALHGLRRAEATVGELVAVVGLGLIGQLTSQLAAAAGCLVVGYDPVKEKVALGREIGGIQAASSEEDFEDLIRTVSNGRGADVAVVTATSSSAEPIRLAAQVVRDRGRLVMVGDVRLDLDRRTFYEKELEVRLARSYGPGRYDAVYEEAGVDYPIGYVRWTEGRNMEAFLSLCAEEKVHPQRLTTHRLPIEAAPEAYALIRESSEVAVGVVLEYPQQLHRPLASVRATESRTTSSGDIGIAVLGTGNFATRVLVPLLRETPGTSVKVVASQKGLSSAQFASRVDHVEAVSGLQDAISREDVHAIVIATPHDSHAELVVAALEADRHVFVEKPLCRVEDELHDVVNAYNRTEKVCMVGFNRRFAPATGAVVGALASVPGPTQVIIRVNAGPLDGHWLADPEVGGGRLVGEGCHFVDLASVLVGLPPSRVAASGIPKQGEGPAGWESFNLLFEYDDGSISSIAYSALGDPRLAKERIEVYRGGLVGIIDDFRVWETWHEGRSTRSGGRKQDKGHRAELAAFVTSCRENREVVPFGEAVQSMLATFAAVRALGSGKGVDVSRVEVRRGP